MFYLCWMLLSATQHSIKCSLIGPLQMCLKEDLLCIYKCPTNNEDLLALTNVFQIMETEWLLQMASKKGRLNGFRKWQAKKED